MKKIAIIDADLVGKKNHRFPNLVCMKLSAYHKQNGDVVFLKLDYENIADYDIAYISKVFTKTEVPQEVLNMSNVQYGGTGFFYDIAPPLPDVIEHIKPDYHLYDEWVTKKLKSGEKASKYTYYTDYSIGFLTRGCFRGCEFCVNKNKKTCDKHSSVYEFIDESRPKLCFLDDNFFACPNWREIIAEVKSIGKKFQFKQGLDERLLNAEKIHEIVSWSYDGDYIFAFDDLNDKDLIVNKLSLIFSLYPNFKKRLKFYVLCGYDRTDKYNMEFWLKDIEGVFERCFTLAKYSALPYIMRYEKCYDSPFAGMYSSIASWANQPNIFKKFDFASFAMCRGMGNKGYAKYKRDTDAYIKDGGKKGSTWRYMEEFKIQTPDIADKYFYVVPDSLLEHGNGNVFKAS